jgi:hypothetical protein
MDPSDIVTAVSGSTFVCHDSNEFIISCVFSLTVWSVEKLVVSLGLLGQLSLLGGLTYKSVTFFVLIIYSLRLSADLLITLFSLLLFTLKSGGIVSRPLRLFKFSSGVKFDLEAITTELVEVQDSWVHDTSQDLGSSRFGTTDGRFLFPVESHEVNAEVAWERIDLLRPIKYSIFLQHVRELLYLAFHRDIKPILQTVNRIIVIINMAGEFKGVLRLHCFWFSLRLHTFFGGLHFYAK